MINTDIYNLSSLILDIEKTYTEESDETLSVGMYGFFNATMSKVFQSALKVSSELANEVFPVRARFDKNVISHAIVANITDINAHPASMDILLCIPEIDYKNFIDNNNTDYMIISKDCKLQIEDFEFHLDYDIKLSQKKLLNNETVYTAKYMMDDYNQLSKEDNPYLPSPFVMNFNMQKYIYINCVIRQIELTNIYNKTISDNDIYNKTYEFTYDNQLACFDVYATDGDKTIHMVPVFEGAVIDPSIQYYCYYTYIDTNRIRVKFDRSSYIPKLNTSINTVIKTTQGSRGNFKYKDNVFISLESTDKYSYDGIQIMMIPQTDSSNGLDKKSISELKKILPKESLSRGIIATATDLNNYFNTLNTSDVKLQVQTKIHNQYERSFYAYILLKNSLNNIVPTNTISMIVDEELFADNITKDADGNKVNLVIKQGSVIGYKYGVNGWSGTLIKDPTDDKLAEYKFVYSLPFMTVISYIGPFVSFYCNVMQTSESLIFSYINELSPIQFISVNILWSRDYNGSSKKYTMSIELMQNINEDMGVLEFEKTEDGKDPVLKKNNLKVIAVIYNKKDTPYRYMVGELDSYNYNTSYTYTYKFDLLCNDIMNQDNFIKIDNTMQIGTENETYGYFTNNPYMDIYVLNKFYDDNGNNVEYGRDKLDNIVPNLNGYTVTNKYTSKNGVTFFRNYTDIMSSVVTPISKTDESGVNGFLIDRIPVIKYSYSKDEGSIQNFISILESTKAYIDNALLILQNQFGIDFKFFNTYGPSTTYFLDSGLTQKIDQVNISATFEVKLNKISDDTTKSSIARDIKLSIENIDLISTIHIPNIITEITNKYSAFIEYIEFKTINSYGPAYQHIYRIEPEDISIVPELLNVDVLNDGLPAISIKIV